ncbi:hypothetical protein [Streptomyces sp. NPDC086787]|uniref:hypothetical protein n=1 Tax=Streptomyces sp. NPDC086787 TaxID=3365759 RepID=UPI0037F89CBA
MACDPAALKSAISTADTGGDAVLNLTPYCVYEYSAQDSGDDALPAITVPLTIHGFHATILRDTGTSTPAFRILDVNGGNLTMDDVTVMNGSVIGVSPSFGGNIYVRGNGTLTTTGVTIQGGRSRALGAGPYIASGSTATLGTGNLATGRYSRGAGIYRAVGVATDIMSLTSTSITGNKATGTGSQTGGPLWTVPLVSGSSVMFAYSPPPREY